MSPLICFCIHCAVRGGWCSDLLVLVVAVGVLIWVSFLFGELDIRVYARRRGRMLLKKTLLRSVVGMLVFFHSGC